MHQYYRLPAICQLYARPADSVACFLSLLRCPSYRNSKFEKAVSENRMNLSNYYFSIFFFFVVRDRKDPMFSVNKCGTLLS